MSGVFWLRAVSSERHTGGRPAQAKHIGSSNGFADEEDSCLPQQYPENVSIWTSS